MLCCVVLCYVCMYNVCDDVMQSNVMLCCVMLCYVMYVCTYVYICIHMYVCMIFLHTCMYTWAVCICIYLAIDITGDDLS